LWEKFPYPSACLSWKVPGAQSFVPVPASAFGKRRQLGLPRVRIAAIEVDSRKDIAQRGGFAF
jgi:hypothetical protein